MPSRPLATATEAKYTKPPVVRGVLQRFPRAILALAEVSQFGTTKHQVPIDDDSFATIPDARGVYSDAEVRHILKEAIEGPVNAEDGMLLHAAQRAWNAMAYLEITLRETEANPELFAPSGHDED